MTDYIKLFKDAESSPTNQPPGCIISKAKPNGRGPWDDKVEILKAAKQVGWQFKYETRSIAYFSKD